jgi:hypothetical protein
MRYTVDIRTTLQYEHSNNRVRPPPRPVSLSKFLKLNHLQAYNTVAVSKSPADLPTLELSAKQQRTCLERVHCSGIRIRCS